MVEQIVEFLRASLPRELVVFFISMLPILELRGGLVAAAILGLEWHIAFPICVVGNMLPIPVVLLFIRKIFAFLKRFKTFKRVIEKLENRAASKSSALNKYRLWGLFAFVGIPLPGTGAWTGSLVANAVDIRFKHSFPIIFAGVLTAGIIMSIISYLIPGFFF